MINKEKIEKILDILDCRIIARVPITASNTFEEVHNEIINTIKDKNCIDLTKFIIQYKLLKIGYLEDVDIKKEITSTLLEKYRLYKDSFLDEYNTYGSIIFTVRLTDKFNIINRYINIDNESESNSELLKEASMDYIGYMTLILCILYDERNKIEHSDIIPIENNFNILGNNKISFEQYIDNAISLVSKYTEIKNLKDTFSDYSINSTLETFCYSHERIVKCFENFCLGYVSSITTAINLSLDLYRNISIYSKNTPENKECTLNNIKELLLVRNEQYNDSFHKFNKQLGPITMLIRLQDKYNRLQNLTEPIKRNEKLNIASIKDTIYDYIGYLILTYIEFTRLY